MFKYFLVFLFIEIKKTFYKLLPFKFFPIDRKKIVFSNYLGMGYGCNPKYIAQKLLSHKELKLVWLVEKETPIENFPEEIKIVDINSIRAYFELFTAKIWVDNFHKIFFIDNFLSKRKGQYFLQTWHGSLGIKKIEADVKSLNNPTSWHKRALKNAKMQDFLFSNSQFEDEVFKSAFWNEGEILRIGHPRNDIFFFDNSEIKRKIHKIYNINENKKIMIYVPTYKQGFTVNSYSIDFERLKDALEKRFSYEWVIMTRLHRNVVQRLNTKGLDFVFDATDYDDAQELLVASDAVITDYSSCIFDFMLTKKPGFIFATDIKNYDQERGFYYPLSDTPFPIAQNNDELVKNILDFDKECFDKKTEDFLSQKGCIEDGNASNRAAELILKLMKLS